MSRKRIATSDLNHKNWDQVEEAEDPGKFSAAPASELRGRTMKLATRRHRPDAGRPDPDSATSSLGRERVQNASSVFGALTNLATSSPRDPARSFFQTPSSSKPNLQFFKVSSSNEVSRSEDRAGERGPAFAPRVEKTLPKTDARAESTVATSRPDVSTSRVGRERTVETSGDGVLESGGGPAPPSSGAAEPGRQGFFRATTAVVERRDKTSLQATNSASTGDLSKKPFEERSLPTVRRGSDSPVHGLGAARDVGPKPTLLEAASRETSGRGTDPASGLDPADGGPRRTSHGVGSRVTFGRATDSMLLGLGGAGNLGSVLTEHEDDTTYGGGPAESRSFRGTDAVIDNAAKHGDSRLLLRPVPADVRARLVAKSAAGGKSLRFLERTYQLNMTTVDWLQILVDQDLTVNIADVFPSYIKELLKLVAQERASNRSEEIQVELSHFQARLRLALDALLLRNPKPTAVEPVPPPGAAAVAPTSLADGVNVEAGSSTQAPGVQVPRLEEQETTNTDDEPPKVTFTPVVEEGHTFTLRCKVFIKKCDPKDPDDTSYQERGVGTLFLKPISAGRVQLIVRAETSLGNLLINTSVSSTTPVQKANKNSVLVVCVPTTNEAGPRTVLLRVKTPQDADQLVEKLKAV